MSKKTNSDGVGCALPGCFSFILWLVSICFFISFLKNCEGRGIVESAIQTTKDYVDVGDSIFNHKVEK